jgi:hypothetical protein
VLALIFNRALPQSYFLNGIGNYFPIQSTDELLPVPVFEQVKKQLDEPDINITMQLSFAFAYLIIFFFISKRKFETDDL